MHHFDYQSGVLCAEDMPITQVAATVGTPFYCYSLATLERHYNVFTEAFGGNDTLVAYSIKANSNLAVVKTLADLGAGADVVSEGELRRAFSAGVPASKCVFSGVGKTSKEMAFALEHDIYQYNVESEPELVQLSRTASERGKTAPICLRVNPDVDAQTHHKISTGKAENKFGIPWSKARDAYSLARRLPGIDVVGIDVHIGSQVTELAPFEAAFSKVAELVGVLREDGHSIERLDLGGGLGIPYDSDGEAPPHPTQYADMIRSVTSGLDVQLIFEPGRLIVGNAGILVSKVLYIKEGDSRRFLILDAAMNDLIRPALYDAFHEIRPVREATKTASISPFDVVGPVCETGDQFARDRELPELEPGELVAIMSAGAYGAVQSSAYNSRPLVPEVLVRGGEMSVIRSRPSYDDMMSNEHLAPWQE